ncbi:MAG: hypothetical protein NDJ89_18435 [Oligoflexia bacterium]|nr:hypothetical protein [Oligoflexia bacterium]
MAKTKTSEQDPSGRESPAQPATASPRPGRGTSEETERRRTRARMLRAANRRRKLGTR